MAERHRERNQRAVQHRRQKSNGKAITLCQGASSINSTLLSSLLTMIVCVVVMGMIT